MRSFNILFGSLLFVSFLLFTNAAKSKNRKPTESIVEGSGSPPSQTVPSVDDEIVRASGVSPDDEDGESERFPSSGNGPPPARPILAKTTTSMSPTTPKPTTPLELNIDEQTEDDDEDEDDDDGEEENYEEPADEDIKPVIRPIQAVFSTVQMTTTTTTTTTRVPFTTRAPPILRTTRLPSSPTIEIMSFDSLRPGILAAISGGAVIGLLFVILLVMFIVYRMRKKDEGSYALDEPNTPHYRYSYQKAPTKEFYA